jgi:hypothetical protein
MSSMLASDLNNPEFAGPINPDSRLAVIFYSKPVVNEFESEKQGRPIFRDVDFVRIMVPGDSTLTVDTFAREDHKKRFPLQWAHYQNKHGGDSREMGTPLTEWQRITRSQAEELRALKFFTVESIATASDAQLQKIGMIAGMSPYSFRDHAVRDLKASQGSAVAKESEDRAKAAEERIVAIEAERQKERDETAQKLADMQAQIQALLPKPKGKPGRKPKVIE